MNKHGYVKAYTSGQWDFKFCTGGVKREVLISEESGICDEYFERSASVQLVVENIIKESGISDRVFKFVPFRMFICS